ncbi:MAG: hypothetical protein FWH23_01335 [Bacteroidales bacterium]|nr:hypothetical protein [Bacteroidales bacterium]
MNKTLILLTLCIMASMTSFAQSELKETWHISPQLLFDKQTEIIYLTYEDWISTECCNKFGSGEDFYFYSDSTFRIRSWRYGPSMGLQEKTVTGKYLYTSENEITLTIAQPERETLQAHLFLSYSEIFLDIIAQNDNKIRVDMYAYEKKGKKNKKISLKQLTFVRVLTAEDEEKMKK